MAPVQRVASGTSRTIRDLRPHTTYFIQVGGASGLSPNYGCDVDDLFIV